VGFGDGADDPARAGTARTHEHLDREHAAQERRPGRPTRRPRALRVGGRRPSGCLLRRRRARDERRAPRRVGSRHILLRDRSTSPFTTAGTPVRPWPVSVAACSSGHGELLFCELPDGTRGALPWWMTDAAACAALTVGTPVVAIAALQELRGLLDTVEARGSAPTGASMLSKEGCDAATESVDPHPGSAVPARRVRAPDRSPGWRSHEVPCRVDVTGTVTHPA